MMVPANPGGRGINTNLAWAPLINSGVTDERVRLRWLSSIYDFLLILKSFDDFESRFLTNVLIFGCSVVLIQAFNQIKFSTVFVLIFCVKTGNFDDFFYKISNNTAIYKRLLFGA